MRTLRNNLVLAMSLGLKDLENKVAQVSSRTSVPLDIVLRVKYSDFSNEKVWAERRGSRRDKAYSPKSIAPVKPKYSRKMYMS